MFPALVGLLMGGLLGGLFVAVIGQMYVQAVGLNDHQAVSAIAAFFHFVPLGALAGAGIGAVFMATGARPVAR
jgi:hypothetical protein